MQLKRPVACIRGTAGIITGDRARRPGLPGDRDRLVDRGRAPASTPSRLNTETCIECSRSDSGQITPLGLPVVPPVYMKSWSAPGRGSAGRGAVAAYRSASSGASGPAPGGGLGPDPDQQPQRRERARGVRHVGRELAAEHQGGGVGVGQQRGQLVLACTGSSR